MENLVKTTAFYSKENDMWVWIGTKENGAKVYNWMHGDDYDAFSKRYCKSDEVLSYFISQVSSFSGDMHSVNLDNKSIIELIWMFTNLEYKMEEVAEKDWNAG